MRHYNGVPTKEAPSMGKPVVHFEIGCKDSPKTQRFYHDLFDWKFDVHGPAAMIAAEAGGIGGHIAWGWGTKLICLRIFMCR